MLFVYCTSKPLAEDHNHNDHKNTDSIINGTKSVVTDSVSKIIQGKLLFSIGVHQFFRKGSINDIGYGETSLKYLMPLAFYKDSNNFYIPDRSRLSLSVLDANGKTSDSIKIPLKDFVFYKIAHIRSHWYLIDFDKGLSVLDAHLVTRHNDEKTTDFYIDESLGNIYFENILNGDRALLDQNRILKEPLRIDYLNCFIDNSMLFGIVDRGDNRYDIIKKNLNDGSESKYLSFDFPCDNCFILPSFLDKNHILSSTDKPSIRDQITVISSDNMGTSNYLLEYPIKVKRLASDVSASISYSGYIYYYDQVSKILYSICTDKDAIKVFSFDLNNLK